MEHEFYTCDCGDDICPICNGGCRHCKICNLIDDDLPVKCQGKSIKISELGMYPPDYKLKVQIMEDGKVSEPLSIQHALYVGSHQEIILIVER